MSSAKGAERGAGLAAVDGKEVDEATFSALSDVEIVGEGVKPEPDGIGAAIGVAEVAAGSGELRHLGAEVDLVEVAFGVDGEPERRGAAGG